MSTRPVRYFDPKLLLELFPGKTAAEVAAILGVKKGTVRAWRCQARTNRIQWFDADRYATSLGLHPVDIWPDWYDWEPVSASA